MNNKFRLMSLGIISTLSINSAYALPIDWSGVFGVDTHLISNFCRTSDDVTKTPAVTSGTQGIDTVDCDATFQTYTMRLNPNIIVNDGVTLKGELSSGYIRGGFAGGDSANSADGSVNNSYFFTTAAQRSALNVNQMYMEMYADTALVKIGRMSKHYGMGITFDGGEDPWDRFLTMYDGIEAEMKIGNFSVIPYYAKISSVSDNADRAGEPAANYDVRELGLIAKYDNKNRDLLVSVLYAKRSSERRNAFYNGNNDSDSTTTFDRGSTEITVIEPFIAKRWNKLRVTAEASLQSGDYGNIYAAGENSQLSAQAYVLNAAYDLNPKWDIGVLAGQATGDDGSSSKFEAAYLHPNFHIADLMFRYHYPSFNEGERSIFDSSITNARFYKLYGNFKTDKWTWKAAAIFATALETAKAGKNAYHHEENYRFASTQKQDDDYGYELDFGFDYMWNPNVTISGYYGYWFVGDYYSFNNTADDLDLENVHGGGLRATLQF
ncbi:MAG: hypothetical protein ACLGHN_03140 [Bacteriovoracia bacterium]